MLNGFKEGDAMRGRVDGVLQAKLKAIVAQIEENNNGRQKIQSVIVICEEMAKLSHGMKVSPVIRKKIEQMKKEMEAEVEQAKNFLNRVAPEQVTLFSCKFIPLLKPFYVLIARTRTNSQSQTKVLLGDQSREQQKKQQERIMETDHQ